jgi:hypothetical protein
MEFDSSFYLGTYQDVNSAYKGDRAGAMNHWLRFGIGEGRLGASSYDYAKHKVPGCGCAPFRTLWMPQDGQTHSTGALSNSGDGRWITTWAAQNKAGMLAAGTAGSVPPGNYRAVFEIYYKQGKGNILGDIVATSDGKQIALKTIRGEDFANFTDGGYQRGWVDFTLPNTSNCVELKFNYANNHYVWLGAISLHTQGHPFYVMHHRRNNLAKVDEAMARGANAIEFDIHPHETRSSSQYEFYVYHYGDINYTQPGDFDAFLTNVKKHIDSGKLKLVMFDTKRTFVRQAGLAPYGSSDLAVYGQGLAAKIKEHGIPADKVVLSAPKDDAMANEGVNCQVDAYVVSGGSGSETDFAGINSWVDSIKAAGATFQGSGLDQDARGPFYTYAYRVAALIKERDKSQELKECISGPWTVRALCDNCWTMAWTAS